MIIQQDSIKSLSIFLSFSHIFTSESWHYQACFSTDATLTWNTAWLHTASHFSVHDPFFVETFQEKVKMSKMFFAAKAQQIAEDLIMANSDG